MRHNPLVKWLFSDQCLFVRLIYLFDKNIVQNLVVFWQLSIGKQMVIIQCCNNVVVIQSQVSVISVIVRKMLIHVSFFLLQLFYTTKISLQNLGLSEKKVLEPQNLPPSCFMKISFVDISFSLKFPKRRQYFGTKQSHASCA